MLTIRALRALRSLYLATHQYLDDSLARKANPRFPDTESAVALNQALADAYRVLDQTGLLQTGHPMDDPVLLGPDSRER